MTKTVKIHAHWALKNGSAEIYLVGKYLYYYKYDRLPFFKVNDEITIAEVGTPTITVPWGWNNLPIDAVRLFR
ncbi:hypothetical protein GKC44_00455 [Lactobacillus parabuchneri]|uniref:Uncharacterized protein n=1 Tax=Lentilactobacillus parabuchneri TaxID=152331 RepID=A0A844EDT2_9LACO|nr:hypothetical protein [Lentilactobacillus parabuchneri]